MRRATNLETKLDAYEASSALSDGAVRKERQRTWPVYAAAAGSGLAMATAAGADIIWSGPQNKSMFFNLTGSAGVGSFYQRGDIALDIDGQGNSFNIHLSRQKLGFIGLDNGLAALGGLGPNRSVLGNSSGNLQRLASGAKISSGAGIFHGNSLNLKSQSNGNFGNPGTHGTWPEGRTGFAGIKFTQAAGPNPGTHYGWIRLEWTANENGFPNTLEAFDWAYNTVPDASILAGQGAVPEPSSLVMGLLASGSVGVLAWRRRKRQGAAATDADGGASEAASN